MFGHFHPRFLAVAWEGFGQGGPFWHEGGGHGHGRHGRHAKRFGGWGEEPRARRGDIKFSLLDLLIEQPRHGYELIKALETQHGGFYKPSPGSVYPTLQMLEEGGYLTSEQVGGKRVYTVTESGRQLLAERNQQTGGRRDPSFDQQKADKSRDLIDLRNTAMELSAAVMQTARGGNPERIGEARAILERAKREIYALLAQEE
ncbi:PadR family transcriptional regulator [Leptolyngbya sp. FACHB-261]|uniref:PadR family transcriptional regulator n=1 Tax=Leptolyngbya sp. FACHB-261 TaxID=2692806 RepID=UPI0016820CF1|nr:PadR family transcriptional regulator [Leptolyngbya sp. FACHB-261]MBD2103394.1 PadR family transcriptional regulator [Leptolyngbya sp. FACHB-261]